MFPPLSSGGASIANLWIPLPILPESPKNCQVNMICLKRLLAQQKKVFCPCNHRLIQETHPLMVRARRIHWFFFA